MNKAHTSRRTPADAVLGQKIRLRRMELDLSQKDLAMKLGITFQQLQKYEKGTNRVSVIPVLIFKMISWIMLLPFGWRSG